MRKLVCIIGLLLSLCMIAVAVLGALGIFFGVRELDGQNLSEIVGVELPEMDLSDAFGEVAAMGETGDLAAGVGTVAAAMPMLVAVELGTTVTDYALFFVLGIVVLFFVGIVGTLVSIYGMNAAGASNKQLKLLRKIAENLAATPATVVVPAPAAAPAPAPAPAAAPAPARPAPAPAPAPVPAPAPAAVPASVTAPSGISLNKRKPAAPAAPASIVAGTSRPGAAGNWICPVCAMENSANDASCVCCGARKDASAQPARQTNGWICQTCGMQNSASASTCAVCGERH